MILKEILNRRTVRDYKSDEVPEEYIMEIIKAAWFAPSGRGTHALEFMVIKNQETKEKIFEIVGQDFIRQAPVLLILLFDTSKVENGLPELSAYDLSVATENAFLQATALGLGTVWKHLGNKEENIKELLDIPDNYKAINIIPIGFSKNNPEAHHETEFSENKIHNERW